MECCKFIKPKKKRDKMFGMIEISVYCFCGKPVKDCKRFSDRGCKHKGTYFHSIDISKPFGDYDRKALSEDSLKVQMEHQLAGQPHKF